VQTYPLYVRGWLCIMSVMFLRAKRRKKDGKVHRYWTIVENRRVCGARVVQRDLLYLGELNDAQHAGWVRAIEALDERGRGGHQMALFPEDLEEIPSVSVEAVRVRLNQIQLCRPRQWGACWLALHLWDLLELDQFWTPLLPPSRKGTRWLSVLKALVAYRVIDPGSEYRFHREWFLGNAMADLLGEDFSLAQKDKPYRCLDRLLAHKEALFDFLKQRWSALFGVSYDVLLYDLTSTYFESEPPEAGSESKKRYGYSRDHRPDCVQVVVALVVTPEGFPLAYDVLPGNTSDNTTLEEFLGKIERRYGKARRVWLMDRGIPTEEVLKKMRRKGIGYLVGTPKGRLTRLEKRLLDKPWTQARESVSVKLLKENKELYVLVESQSRVSKERAMRRRRLKALWTSLKQLRSRKRLTRDQLLMSLGAARKAAGRAWRLVSIHTPGPNERVSSKTFHFHLDREALRQARRREGRYLLRSYLVDQPADSIWEMYLLLTRIEQAFKDIKGDLSIRPIWHHDDPRIEAHIFVCFLAYCLHTTLRNLARSSASGLTSHAIVEKLSKIQMIDVHLPTTDGREIVMSRYTQPEHDVALVVTQLGLTLPPQPLPKINIKSLPHPENPSQSVKVRSADS
jgi:transposase